MEKIYRKSMTFEQRKMIEFITYDVITYLIKYQDLSMNEAIHVFYTSNTFVKLEDVSTGLYSGGVLLMYMFC